MTVNAIWHPLAIDLVDYVEGPFKSPRIARHLRRCTGCRKAAIRIEKSAPRNMDEFCEACGWWMSEHIENPPAGCEILQASRPELFEEEDDFDWLDDLEDADGEE